MQTQVPERIIDADAHFVEPSDMWHRYLAPKYHWAAPRRFLDSQGRNRAFVAGVARPYVPRNPHVKPMTEVPGGYLPRERVADMKRAGVDVMVNYPSTGLEFFSVTEAEVCAALCRAYNDWASEFCSYDAKRFVAPAVVPQIDINATLVEARRAIVELKMNGIFMRPNPIGGRTLDHPAFEPLWDLLEEIGAPLVLHEGTSGHGPQQIPQVAIDRYENFLFRHMITHPFEQQLGLLSLICGGVLQRHPKLNVLIVECGCAWAPYWLDRMDDHIEHWGHASLKLELKPTEYFKRQCYIAAEGNERLLPFVVDAIGDDNLCFSTDYPHPDHPYIGVVEGLKEMKGLSAQSKRKILSENAARLFKL